MPYHKGMLKVFAQENTLPNRKKPYVFKSRNIGTIDEEYIVKEKPMHQIAREQGLSMGLIYNRIKEYNIPSRHHLTKEAKKTL